MKILRLVPSALSVGRGAPSSFTESFPVASLSFPNVSVNRFAIHSQFAKGKLIVQSFPLSLQPTCEKVVDKYVEFDAVILLLDVLLLRIQSYRHLIFNYGIQSSVRPVVLIPINASCMQEETGRCFVASLIVNLLFASVGRFSM